jgi:hypothetical protein
MTKIRLTEEMVRRIEDALDERKVARRGESDVDRSRIERRCSNGRRSTDRPADAKDPRSGGD